MSSFRTNPADDLRAMRRREMARCERDRKIGRAALIVACALAVFLAAYGLVSLIGSYA